MSVKSAPYYWVVCDLCGERPADEYAAWDNDDDAEQDATEADYDAEGGNHVCDECVPHPPDWDDEHEAFLKGDTDVLDCKWCMP